MRTKILDIITMETLIIIFFIRVEQQIQRGFYSIRHERHKRLTIKKKKRSNRISNILKEQNRRHKKRLYTLLKNI